MGLLSFVDNRYFVFVVGMLMMGAGGTQYLVGVYSADMKETLAFTQSELNLVLTGANVGLYVLGIITGSVYDQYGPRLTALIAAVFLSFGYLAVWLSVTAQITTSSTLMLIYFLGTGLGSSALYSCALAVNVKNFPDPAQAGKVIGVLVAAFGISSAIFSEIYEVWFDPDYKTFLLFLSMTLAFVASTGIVFAQELPPPAKKGAYVSINSDNDIDENNGGGGNDGGAGAEEEKAPLVDYTSVEVTVLGYGGGAKRNYTSWEMLSNKGFLLMWLGFGVVAGCGLTVINNIANIIQSLDGDSDSKATLVTVMSLANAAGRLVYGYASDVGRSHAARPRFFTLIILMMGVAQMLMSVSSASMVFFAAPFVTFQYGGLFAIVPTIISEFYGKESFGKNISITTASAGATSILFATVIAGGIYDAQADENNECYGKSCYQYTYWILAATCLVSALLSLLIPRYMNYDHLRPMNASR